MDLSFERGDELAREHRQLPADQYRSLHLLYSRSGETRLIVPIRSMQYLAAVDRDEVLFVDAQGPRFVELAWRDFRPGTRAGLDAPVAYTCIYYKEKGRVSMARLQVEFHKALQQFERRQPRNAGGATVTPLKRGRRR